MLIWIISSFRQCSTTLFWTSTFPTTLPANGPEIFSSAWTQDLIYCPAHCWRGTSPFLFQNSTFRHILRSVRQPSHSTLFLALAALMEKLQKGVGKTSTWLHQAQRRWDLGHDMTSLMITLDIQIGKRWQDFISKSTFVDHIAYIFRFKSAEKTEGSNFKARRTSRCIRQAWSRTWVKQIVRIGRVVCPGQKMGGRPHEGEFVWAKRQQ